MTKQAKRSFQQSLLWLLFLGPFFFIIYGFCNWWTAQRLGVGSVVFDWEKQIPFVPWFIWPYLSVDLFFVIALFLPQTRQSLNTHAYRLMTAIIISAIGFLLFPLRFSFDIPHTDGLTGLAFQALLTLDQPYNQAPSLHISLLMILWVKYAQVFKDGLRLSIDVWFFLIFISVLLVYQHHVIDVITGAVVGLACLYLIPENGWRWIQNRKNKKLATRYGLSGIALLLIAVIAQGLAWLLLWPAIALIIIALGYAGLGSGVFQKRPDGKHPWPAKLLLQPFLYGARRSARGYNRQLDAYNMITDKLALGGYRAPYAQRWDAVLDMTGEFEATHRTRQYYSLPVLDLTSPRPPVILEALAWLSKQDPSATICIHCALGLSRSAIIMAAWLVQSGQADNAEKAFAMISEKRPIVWKKRHEQLVDHVCALAQAST